MIKIFWFKHYATAWEAQFGRLWIHIRYPRFWKTSGLGFIRWVEKPLPRGTRSMKHGTPCQCGTCGGEGRWDDLKHASGPNMCIFEDAVWFNAFEGHIECHECWLK